MLVRNNYNECITNFACSIRKYFQLKYKHNTLEYVDKILEEKQPENIVVILFDGMGSKILDRTLDNTSLFRKNKMKDITTVFPATTTAATTSIRTGLNPVELLELLERTTSIEQRAVSFKVKNDLKEKFETTFNKLFGEDFSLYDKETIIQSGLFGDGKKHELFESAIGDFIAIAEHSNKSLITDGDEELFSHHAGYTDDEIFVPLIIIDKTG